MTTRKDAQRVRRTAALAVIVKDHGVEIKSAKVVLWENGAKDRKPRAYRPCPCGCDERGGKKIVGYISASDKDGNGFTLYAPDEETFRRFARVFGESIG